MGIPGDQLFKDTFFCIGDIAVCDNHSGFWADITLYMMSFAVNETDKRLLDRNCPLQHRFHNRIIAAVPQTADINNGVTFCDQRVNFNSIVTDDAFAGRFSPASVTPDTVRDFKCRQINQVNIRLVNDEVERPVRHNEFQIRHPHFE